MAGQNQLECGCYSGVVEVRRVRRPRQRGRESLQTETNTDRRTVEQTRRKRRGRTLQLDQARLKRMIEKLMDTLESDQISTKASVGELIKLLQVYKDLSVEQVREVEVRWVDQFREDDEPER